MSIEKPKVFISYAWTNEEYTERVIDFARRLIDDGIDVLLDKFEMLPGKELNNFMETSVKDQSVTNVLILLNPTYAERADKRKGGVGKETQIISEEVYKDVEQTKFMPVIFDVENNDYSLSSPTYLSTRVYADLSNPETYDLEYMNLVKVLFGKPTYTKPKLGDRPKWVDEELMKSSSVYAIQKYGSRSYSDKIPIELIDDTLESIVNNIINDPIFIDEKSWDKNAFYETYSHLLKYRNDFLEILIKSINVKGITDSIRKFFDMIYEESVKFNDYTQEKRDFLKTYIHEVFIYCIGYYLKKDKYNLLNELVYTPFINPNIYDRKLIYFRDFIYSANDNVGIYLKDYYDKKDSKNYLSGKAHAWIENINERILSKQEFVDGDIILASLSLLTEDVSDYTWFPISYVYSNTRQSKLEKIGSSLRSKRLGLKFIKIFDCESIEAVKEQLAKIEDFYRTKKYYFGYSEVSREIPFITNYISSDKVGIEK